MQETILRKYLDLDDDIRRRMYFEQSLKGMSGASHKVEFSWYSITPAHMETGQEIPASYGLTVGQIDDMSQSVRIHLPDGKSAILARHSPIARLAPNLRRFLDAHSIDLRLINVSDESVDVDVVDKSDLLASLESKRVGAQRFNGTTKLGSGIQTIEKAKQASLVAIDIDLANNGNVKPLGPQADAKRTLSFVALGNGVHWTDKDKNVLRTYVDFTYLVKDDSIIRYANYVKDLAGEENDFIDFFQNYFKGMTKQPVDDFEVLDEDFVIITPEDEGRPFRDVIADHLARHNPL